MKCIKCQGSLITEDKNGIIITECLKCSDIQRYKKFGVEIKMTDEFVPREPDWKGNGVAVWENEKEGRKYLSIQLFGRKEMTIYANKYTPKEKE